MSSKSTTADRPRVFVPCRFPDLSPPPLQYPRSELTVSPSLPKSIGKSCPR